MIAILKREIKSYLKHPLFWIGIVIVICGVFSEVSPYLTTHYLALGEEIINEYPETIHSGEVYEGYIPSSSKMQREIWHETVKRTLMEEFKVSESEAQSAIEKMEDMDLKEAYTYLEETYE